MRRSVLAVACLCLGGVWTAQPLSAIADDDGRVVVTADGGRYVGPMVSGKRQGQGRVEWTNGAYYEGEFDDGLFSGKGRMRFPAGDIYEGEFEKGMPSGKGRLTMSYGATYVGDFHDAVMDGQGRFDNGNGTVYEGAFKASLYHGQGRMVGPTEEYSGEFRLGEMWGKGEVSNKDGRKYTGDFVRGQFEGKGRLAYPSGATYEGDFVGGEFTGQGVVTWPGGMKHEGRFRNWMPEGPGTFSDGSGNTYEGEFKGWDLVGTARIQAKDGSRYQGEVKNKMPHGKGELHRANGDVYKGGFQYGEFDGEGTLTYAKAQSDGRTQDSGVWQYGRFKKIAEEERRQTRANVELALYSQANLLSGVGNELAPRDPGSINLYLLAIAGDGSQEVFRREVDFVRSQFDTSFDTKGHSLVLANSRNTVGTAALATVTSVRKALAALAAAMDKERDILFLYITSHGSKEKEISLGLAGMELPGLSAHDLGAMLKESGIRWKVVVISACYAGGFIDEVKDPHTLFITASRHDRRSFGCADENEFTYFGRAYFKEALPTADSFEDAFLRARTLITEWEDKDIQRHAASDSKEASKDADPHSLPQIENPPQVREYLQRWWAQHMAAHPRADGPAPASGGDSRPAIIKMSAE